MIIDRLFGFHIEFTTVRSGAIMNPLDLTHPNTHEHTRSTGLVRFSKGIPIMNTSAPRRTEKHQETRREFLRSLAAGAGAFCLMSGVRRVQGEENLPAPEFLLEWGTPGKEPGEFSACVGIAIGENDTVYTAEFRNERVQKFTSEGKFLGTFSVQPHAGGVAVDAAGNVYVAHWNSNKVAVYAPDGKQLREWGVKGTVDGEFQLPGSIAIGPDGLVYVPDQGNSRVQKFTPEGKFVGKWGTL